MHFYPRSPCGERRIHYDNFNLHCVISIHALLAESDAIDVFLAVWAIISIHALLAESDVTPEVSERVPLAISIHALLAESDALSQSSAISAPEISIHALLAESDGGSVILII